MLTDGHILAVPSVWRRRLAVHGITPSADIGRGGSWWIVIAVVNVPLHQTTRVIKRQGESSGMCRTQVGLEISAPEIVQPRDCSNRCVGPRLSIVKIAVSINAYVSIATLASSSHLR
jgi:hypothetical protein